MSDKNETGADASPIETSSSGSAAPEIDNVRNSITILIYKKSL